MLENLSRNLAPVLRSVRRRPGLLPATTDLAMWAFAFLFAGFLRLINSTAMNPLQLATAAVAAMVVQLAVGLALGIYRSRWRVTSFEEVTAVTAAWASAATVALIISQLGATPFIDAPRFSTAAGALLAWVSMLLSRALWRYVWELQRRPVPGECKKTIILGAGEGGARMVKTMLSDPDSAYYPSALLDDDPALRNRRIGNVVVEGTRHDLAEVACRHGAEVLLVAITGATGKLIQEASSLAHDAGLEIRVLPSTSELVRKMTVTDVRPPTVEDLLGRDPVEIDLESVAGYLKNKVVLITGAGGSIGSELSRQVSMFSPRKLYLLDRDESALHGLQLSMQGRALLDDDSLVVADIRDRVRIQELFKALEPQVVFHTAALKHLTLLQNHPAEAVKTNVIGTNNLLDAATEVGVERFVNISTDKAADPTSVLGATKLAAERLTAIAAHKEQTHYLSVRFGNVLGSRGSVLPTFLDQIEKGNRLTVTDPEATRFFMTIPEAVRLVVQAGAIGSPGEVLVLDMGEPVRIVDLANQLIRLLRPGLGIDFTGLRPGEKKHEALLATEEIGATRVHPRIIHTMAEVKSPVEALRVLDGEVVEEARKRLSCEIHAV